MLYFLHQKELKGALLMLSAKGDILMIELFDSFIKNLSNREAAIAIWILVGLILALTQNKFRKSLLLVFKSFFAWKLTISYLVMFSYIAIMLLVLHAVGIWRVAYITTTILWVVCVGFVMLLETSKANDESFFKNSVKDNLKVLIVLEFLINFYVFSLWLELLLVPVFVILGGLLGIASYNKQYASLQKSLNYIMVIIGTFLIGYVLYMTVSDFNKLITLNNFENFILPVLLSIMFLPFIYFWTLYLNYETLFGRLQFFVSDRALLPYVKKKTILAFGLNLWVLNKWSRHINTLRFENKNNVVEAIREFKSAKFTISENL